MPRGTTPNKIQFSDYLQGVLARYLEDPWNTLPREDPEWRELLADKGKRFRGELDEIAHEIFFRMGELPGKEDPDALEKALKPVKEAWKKFRKLARIAATVESLLRNKGWTATKVLREYRGNPGWNERYRHFERLHAFTYRRSADGKAAIKKYWATEEAKTKRMNRESKPEFRKAERERKREAYWAKKLASTVDVTPVEPSKKVEFDLEAMLAEVCE